MSFLENLTPLVLTYNEEPNIGRTLEKLSWASTVFVIDSFSDDKTLEIIAQYPNVRMFQRHFDNFADQWNFGISYIDTDWVLSLDADYLLSDELVREMSVLPATPNLNAYYIEFKYCVGGKALRGSLLPPRCALFRKSKASYINDGHTQMLKVEGPTEFFKSTPNVWLFIVGQYEGGKVFKEAHGYHSSKN